MPSIKDVAKVAGVTIGTVSRAFNGYSDISESTKERIFAAAAQLGYKPNINAKSLSSKVSSNIGVLIVGLLESSEKDNLVFSLLKGVLKYTHSHDLEAAIYSIDSNAKKQRSYTEFCNEHSIAGVILSGITVDDPYFRELVKSNIPCVVVDIDASGQNLGCVSIDNITAMFEITDYVIKMGHRKIIAISGKKNAMVTVERTAGFFEACKANGIAVSTGNFIYCDYSEQEAYKNTLQYISKNGTGSATAFVCMSDVMALGVIRAIRELGYSIPNDFSVTGFDGLPITEYTEPELTTVKQNMEAVGYEGVDLLHKIIRHEPHEKHVIVEHQLCLRNSVQKLGDVC